MINLSHGGFTIHAQEGGYGSHGGLAVYVICECGRGYSWERQIPAAELLTWLANHGTDIPLDEEKRRVEAAGEREATVKLVRADGPAPGPPVGAEVLEVAGMRTWVEWKDEP